MLSFHIFTVHRLRAFVLLTRDSCLERNPFTYCTVKYIRLQAYILVRYTNNTLFHPAGGIRFERKKFSNFYYCIRMRTENTHTRTRAGAHTHTHTRTCFTKHESRCLFAVGKAPPLSSKNREKRLRLFSET
jgi:hypothetical protein